MAILTLILSNMSLSNTKQHAVKFVFDSDIALRVSFC